MDDKIKFTLVTISVVISIVSLMAVGYFVTTLAVHTSEEVRDKAAPSLDAVHDMRFGILRIISSTNELLVLSASRGSEKGAKTAEAEAEEDELANQGFKVYEDALQRFTYHYDMDHTRAGEFSHESMRKLDERYRNLRSTAHELIKSADQGFNPSVISLLKSKFEKQEREILKNIESILRDHRAIANASISSVINEVNWLNYISLVVAVISTFVLLSYFIFIKRLMAKEIKARNMAQLANRTKTDMIANMNHELRTPLNAIIGFSCMMKDEIFGSLGQDIYKDYLLDIHYSAEHLLDIVNDILDVSAIELDEMKLSEENISIVSVVDSSIRLIQSRADKVQVSVSSNLDPKLPKIFADERRVKQVVLNLLSNAVKFTLGGGEVSVNAWLEDDGSFAISITDTGIGMNEEDVAMALTRFGQVDSGLNRRVQEGTGLGMPLSIGLMEQHGGTLKIKSEKGQGTMITLTFPKERIVQNVC